MPIDKSILVNSTILVITIIVNIALLAIHFCSTEPTNMYTNALIGDTLLLITQCLFAFIHTPPTVPIPVDPTVLDTSKQKIQTLISDWISEELLLTSMVIETVGFKYTFLGQIAPINFKAILFVEEVEIVLSKAIKDNEEVRSFSHFLDLIRTIHLEIDPVVLETYKARYFHSLTDDVLGPNSYAHTEESIIPIMKKYPWLWILELVATHPKVQSYTASTSSVVTVDRSVQMERGISIPQDDGTIEM